MGRGDVKRREGTASSPQRGAGALRNTVWGRAGRDREDGIRGSRAHWGCGSRLREATEPRDAGPGAEGAAAGRQERRDRGPELGPGGPTLTRSEPRQPWIPGLYSSSVSGAQGSRRSWMTRPGGGMGPQATSPSLVPLP